MIFFMVFLTSNKNADQILAAPKIYYKVIGPCFYNRKIDVLFPPGAATDVGLPKNKQIQIIVLLNNK